MDSNYLTYMRKILFAVALIQQLEVRYPVGQGRKQTLQVCVEFYFRDKGCRTHLQLVIKINVFSTLHTHYDVNTYGHDSAAGLPFCCICWKHGGLYRLQVIAW